MLKKMQSRERKRDKLFKLFRAKPTTTGGSALTTPGILTSSTEGNLGLSSQAKVAGSSNDDQLSQLPLSSQSIIAAQAVPIASTTTAAGDVDLSTDLWRRAYEDLKAREKSLVEDFERSVKHVASQNVSSEQTPLDHETMMIIA